MKFIRVLLIIFLMFIFVGCKTVQETPDVPNDSIDDNYNDNNNNDDNNQNDDNQDNNENLVEFSVSLIYNKKIYIPIEGEIINVVWADDYSQYTQKLNSEGFAKINLDGNFYVFLSNCPAEYTYNPNIYFANNENPVVEIELYKIAKVSKGKGTALYNEFEISSNGVYRAEVPSATKKVYYEYKPTKAGYYVIETLVNVYQDNVNPKLITYKGTNAYKDEMNPTIYDGGGEFLKGGYTKNVKWVVKLADQELNNVFTFGVYADSKTGIYPVNVDFKISYEGEYYYSDIVSEFKVAEEADFVTPEFSDDKYTYYNSNGGVGNYYGSKINGGNIIIGKNYMYNEATGYYHYIVDGQPGPILCAAITTPCAYLEESFKNMESHGNKALTVNAGTENYKQFIEVQYAAVCNSDGVCYVTKELKDFLQKFSISQSLFFDGNGFIEDMGIYAAEDDQWLFACGYYLKK